MSFICLNSTTISKSVVRYDYSVSDDISHYFNFDKVFSIDYQAILESVPTSILNIPFVANVLPIIWITDSDLIISKLDEDFYNCIPNLKKGYETMFPETQFLGKITVEEIIKSDRKTVEDKCAMFYSGGVDSIQTLISHLDEKPDLLSIWGSDIQYDNAEGWKLVYSAIEEASLKYDLKNYVIHSAFHEFDNDGELNKSFRMQLKDNWWHGVKHGIALLGHVAPLAYLYGYSKMYIASSNCPKDGHVRCASNPLTDNQVRFCGCQVFHDGFEYSRQDKVHNIVNYYQQKNDTVTIHACWESQSGSNCCICEKCYRTMTAIIAEGGNPVQYGFNDVKKAMKNLHFFIATNKYQDAIWKHWPHIQEAIKKNRKYIKKTPYWKDIKWMLDVDFYKPESIVFLDKIVAKRIRTWLSQFKFYQALHNLKAKH